MTNRFKVFLGFAISVCIALSMMGDGYAFRNDSSYRLNMKSSQAPRKSNSFSTAGKFMGSIKGSISIGGKNVLVTDKTSVYVVGEGIKKSGYFVSDASLYVGGIMKKGVPLATIIIVRPARSSGWSSHSPSGESRYQIPSKSNPDVGMYRENIPG